MKEAELRKHATCDLCRRRILESGLPLFGASPSSGSASTCAPAGAADTSAEPHNAMTAAFLATEAAA